MDSTRVFQYGNAQAVRLPKKYRFNSSEVWIERNEDGSITLREKPLKPRGYANILSYLLAHPLATKVEPTDALFQRSSERFKDIF